MFKVLFNCFNRLSKDWELIPDFTTIESIVGEAHKRLSANQQVSIAVSINESDDKFADKVAKAEKMLSEIANLLNLSYSSDRRISVKGNFQSIRAFEPQGVDSDGKFDIKSLAQFQRS